MDIEFKDREELYKRVVPALRVKKRLFLKKGINVSENDIFEYLAKEKWSKGINVTLSDVVSDILNVEETSFIGR